MNKKYIFFDLDGTLTDPKEGITRSVAYALEKFGIHVENLDTLTPFIGPPLVESFRDFYGFGPEKADKAVEYYREYFSVKGIFENKVYAGIPGLLEKLRGQNKVIVLATSKPEEFAKMILEHFDIAKYFDHICGASMDRSRNTKSAVVAYALKTCGAENPSDVLMVGDRLHDVEGARENGIETAGVLYGYGTLEEMKSCQAAYIAETAEDLERLLTA